MSLKSSSIVGNFRNFTLFDDVHRFLRHRRKREKGREKKKKKKIIIIKRRRKREKEDAVKKEEESFRHGITITYR